MTVVDTSGLTGRQLLEAVRDGFGARPGVARLLGMRIDEIDDGRVVFSLDTTPDMVNPLGTVHGGITSTLLDSAMSCAVHSTLPAGATYTTVDLKVTFTRAARPDGTRLVCEGRVVHAGGRIGTATGEVRDGEGRLIAHGTATCLVMRPDPR